MGYSQSMPSYVTLPEYEVTKAQHAEIAALRNASFPDHQVPRSYYKQFPHLRILALEEERLVGHVGVDYRAIRLGEVVVRTLGVIDLCVAIDSRGRGIAAELLRALSLLGERDLADFVVLCADDDRLYRRLGFTRQSNTCHWLRIDEHRNFGVAVESLGDCLMVKPLGGRLWTSHDVDFLGYLF